MGRKITQNMKKDKNGEGFVVYLDVYGFEAAVLEKDLDEITLKMKDCCDEIDNILKRSFPVQKYIFSDCLFLFYPVSEKSKIGNRLVRCIRDTQKILTIFMNSDFPMRGGLAYGEVKHGTNYMIGKPVIRAVRYEKMIAAPVVLFPEREVAWFTREKQSGYIVRFPRQTDYFKSIPLKDNMSMRAKLIMPDEVETFRELIEKKADQFLLFGPYEVARAWENAHEFMKQFIRIK